MIISMASLMSVSSYEHYELGKLLQITDGVFDEHYIDNVGNNVFIKRCGRKNAPKILIDTHFDEIGMLVTDIKENGFLTVTNVGGVDTRILQAGELVIYGKKEKVYGVVASTPPHLKKGSAANEIKPIEELYIDTGISKESMEGNISIGTPVGFKPKYTELLNGQLAGKGFDNKACAACAIYAISQTKSSELAGDVYFVMSIQEETSRYGGVAPSVYGISPDYAMVVDVNLGKTPDTPKYDTVDMFGGASLTCAPVTDKILTRMLCDEAKEANIKYQLCASGRGTGTNTPDVNLTGRGIPTVDVGLPLKSMHTYNEVIALSDAQEVSNLIKAFISSEKIAEVFAK